MVSFNSTVRIVVPVLSVMALIGMVTCLFWYSLAFNVLS